MRGASEQIEGLVILQSHEVEKHRSYLQSIYKVRFNRVLKKIKDIIRTDYDSENTTKAAEKALTKKIKNTLTEEMAEIKKELYSDVENFTTDSAKLYGDQLTAVYEPVKEFIDVNFPDEEDVLKGFNKDHLTFEKGDHTVDSIWVTFLASLMATIESAIQQAYNLEQDEKDFESNLFGVGGETNKSNNHLNSVIAVLVAHGFNTGLKYGNLANEKIISGYIWQSVMDSKTSDICIYLDGRTYYYGFPSKGTMPYEIYAPAHFNCRSSTTPITKSYTDLGIDPEELTSDQKILLSGQNPQVETYSEFFEKQPTAVKREILGPTRYSMYTQNNLTVDKFYTRDGRKYSLNELMQKGYKVSSQYLQYIRK